MKNKLAERVTVRRNELEMSRKKLADALGTNETQIWRYESERNDPTAEVVYELCQALHTSADWLLGFSETTEIIHPTKKRYILKTPVGDLHHRLGKLDSLEAEVIEELRKKTPEARQKALEIIRLL